MNENNKDDDRNRKLEENLEKLKRKGGKPVADENCVKSTSVGGSEGEWERDRERDGRIPQFVGVKLRMTKFEDDYNNERLCWKMYLICI